MTAITEQELKALLEFARSEGRYWRNMLRHCWATGNYRSHDGQTLQHLRNTRGLNWLTAMKLNTETGEYK